MEAVDNYIKNQKFSQKEILQRVRGIILKTFPKIKEDFWLGVPWYDHKYYIVGLKDHVNIGFCIEGMSEKELALFEGKGKMMRHIKIFSLDEIDEKKIVRLLKVLK